MKRRHLILAALLATGCAAAPPGAEPPSQPPAGSPATIVVQNDTPEGIGINVFIVPEGAGQRRSLGTVEGGRSATFAYQLPDSGYFQLVAQQLTDGAEVRSERFRLSSGDVATWNRAINRVAVGRR